jgi:hypothetical protein
MAKDSKPKGFSGPTKEALEQAHQALDTYFDFLKQSVSSAPSGGMELGENLKKQGVENITAFQEVVKRLSKAENLEEALRIQTAFIHSQLNALGKQVTIWGEAFTKAAEEVAKKSDK